MEIQIIKPYDTADFKYNRSKHRYVLDKTVITALGGQYKNETIATRRLESISKAVYRYIYEHGNSANRYYVEFILNCTREGREMLYNAMYEQLTADVDNGYEDGAKQNLIDFATGNIIDREQVKKNRLAIDAECEIHSGILPINILYAGAFAVAPYYYQNKDELYEKYEY